jgi:hypothetical protein
MLASFLTVINLEFFVVICTLSNFLVIDSVEFFTFFRMVVDSELSIGSAFE